MRFEIEGWLRNDGKYLTVFDEKNRTRIRVLLAIGLRMTMNPPDGIRKR